MEKKIYIPKAIYGKDQYGVKIQLFAEGTEEDQHIYNIKVNSVTVLNPEDLPEPVGDVTKTSFNAGLLDLKAPVEEKPVEAKKEAKAEVEKTEVEKTEAEKPAPVEKAEETEKPSKKDKGK